MCISLSISVLPSVSALDVTSTSGWSMLESAEMVTWSRAHALSWVTGEISSYATLCSEELSKGSGCNASNLVESFAIALAYMNWATANVSVDTTGTGKQWTVFESPIAADFKIGADYMATLENIRSLIISNNILANGYSSTTQNAMTTAVASALPSAENFMASGTLNDKAQYYNMFWKVVEAYCDYSILEVLMTELGVTGSSNDKASFESAIFGKIPQTEWESLGTVTSSTEMANLLDRVKSKIAPYLRVYNQCLSAYRNTLSIGLAEEEFVASDYTYKLIPYQCTDRLQLNAENNYMSTVTRALHGYFYSVTSSQPGVSSDLEVDLANGILKALSNATNSGGEITFDGATPELTKLGYYILAAGSTYEPFNSTAGDAGFIETLYKFLREETQRKEITTVVEKAVNTKKPIYVTKGNKNIIDSATEIAPLKSAEYRYARLSDLFVVNQTTTNIFCLAKNSLQISNVDSSTLEYVKSSGTGATVNENGEVTAEMDSSTTTTLVGSDLFIASSNDMTAPVAIASGESRSVWDMFDNDSSSFLYRQIGCLTSVIMTNIQASCKSTEYLGSPETHMLFMNGFGDIVLSDNTIVLPAVANPVLYNYDMIPVSDAINMPTITSGYYPYTATFCNYYPRISISPDSNGDHKLQQGGAYEGKYIIYGKDGWNRFEATYIRGGNSESAKVNIDLGVFAIAPIMAESWSTSENEINVENFLKYYPAASSGNIFTGNKWGNFMIYSKMTATSSGVNEFFPINDIATDGEDLYLKKSTIITTSCLRFLSDNFDSSLQSSGKFRIESYIRDFMGEGLNGTMYSEAIVKNAQLNLDTLLNDQYGRFTLFFRDLVGSFIDTLGRIDGVLAIKNCYENKFFNVISGFVKEYYGLLVVAILTIMAVKMLRGRCNLTYILFSGAFAFSAFQVYAMWMPTSMPALYNFAVNDVAEEISWTTVINQVERYNETYADASRVDAASGKPKPYTSTITLYTLSGSEMEAMATQLGVSEEKIYSGEIIFLDSVAGIFLEGNSIKMSVDKLFVNNSMQGLYNSQWKEFYHSETTVQGSHLGNSNPYTIRLTGPYVSLEAYYMPFCHIERSFLGNLNDFCNVFDLEREVYRYSRSFAKDAFVFKNFVNSGIFLAPNDDSYLAGNVRIDGSDSVDIQVMEVVNAVHQFFQNQEDWLGISDFLLNPGQDVTDTLWGKMLKEGGYYSEQFTVDNEVRMAKMAGLISYVNDQTKKFILEHLDSLIFCSDENAVKIVSLYATTAFTHYVSEWGRWLYPNYLNAADLELVDILYMSMTDTSDKVHFEDGEIVGIMTRNLGIPGLIMVMLVTLISVIFIFLVTYLIPVLYAMFGALMLFRLLNDDSNVHLVSGYAKVSLSTIVLYLIFNLSFRFIAIGGYNWYGYVGCIIVMFLCLYFLLAVIMSVVASFQDLGDSTLTRSLENALSKLTKGALQNVTARVAHIRGPAHFGYGNYGNYRRRSSVDWHRGYEPYRDDYYSPIHQFSRESDIDETHYQRSFLRNRNRRIHWPTSRW